MLKLNRLLNLNIGCLALLIFGSAVLPQVHASSQTTDVAYVGLYHFSSEVRGKPIASVYVHTGVLIRSSGPFSENKTLWMGVQHLQLNNQGDHFFGKSLLQASTLWTSGPQQSIIGPIVQYWVYFKDGTSLITKPFVYKNNAQALDPHRGDSWKVKLNDLRKTMDEDTDAALTHFRGISATY